MHGKFFNIVFANTIFKLFCSARLIETIKNSSVRKVHISSAPCSPDNFKLLDFDFGESFSFFD